MLFLATIVISPGAAEVLWTYFPSQHRKYYKNRYSRVKINKINDCTALSGTFFNKTGFSFSNCEYWLFFSPSNCMLLFSHLVMSDSLRPHGLQYTWLSCLLPTSGACSNSYESVMPSNHLTLCRPLLLLPSIFPSIRVFF